MIENLNFLRREERLALKLKALYKSYGYREYKLSSFDEYALYADNQSFLAGKDVISLSVGDKLLALRPDVTLSIIKNYPPVSGTEKLFYDEKVYRKSVRGGGFSEVSQIGVEVIGEVDLGVEAEICALILKTLAASEKEFVLDVSHMGIVVKAVNALGLGSAKSDKVLTFLENKNVHDFVRYAKECGADEKMIQAFEELMTLPASPGEAKEKLLTIGKLVNCTEEVHALYQLIEAVGRKELQIDFSIGGDAEYYNGVIFKGYIKGMPEAVLSGGRYDKLLKKFNREEQALGFALYLGELGKYLGGSEDAPCAVLVYKEANAPVAFQKAERLRSEGKKVLMTRHLPEGFEGEIYDAEDGND